MTRFQLLVRLYGAEDRQNFGGAPMSRGELRMKEAMEADGRSHVWLGPTGSRQCIDNTAAGRVNAYGRTLTKHGAPLGGTRAQRQAVKRRHRRQPLPTGFCASMAEDAPF